MKTTEEQIRAMASQWPGFNLVEREDQRATWEGPLAPDKRKHLVRVRYRIPHLLENISLLDAQPRVQVVVPLLERHADYEQGPIPHVYRSEATPEMPCLCLFSPSNREWSTDDLIAHTTIFWAWEWLYFYEGWLVTKKWKGGGRHLAPSGAEGKRIATG
jgi:hypothetical protein